MLCSNIFIINNLQKEIEKGDGPIGLILAPTRELAQQVCLKLNSNLFLFYNNYEKKGNNNLLQTIVVDIAACVLCSLYIEEVEYQQLTHVTISYVQAV